MAIQLILPAGGASLSTDTFVPLTSLYINIESWNYVKGIKCQQIVPRAYISEEAYRAGAKHQNVEVITDTFLDEVPAGEAGIERAYAVLKERIATYLGAGGAEALTDI